MNAVPYALATDMIARYSNRDLVELSNEDPTQTSVNTGTLQQALDDASAEIDGYLESRFALPLNDPPTVLTRMTCDIAMYRMQSLRPLHDLADARKRYDDAIELLMRVARGEVTLGLAADNAEPAQAAGSVVTQAGSDTSGPLQQRIFGRGSLKNY
jgi:phage gp36-like protein